MVAIEASQGKIRSAIKYISGLALLALGFVTIVFFSSSRSFNNSSVSDHSGDGSLGSLNPDVANADACSGGGCSCGCGK